MSLVVLRRLSLPSGPSPAGTWTPRSPRTLARHLHPAAAPAVLHHEDRARLAEALAADLPCQPLLEQLRVDANRERVWERIAVAPSWEAWAIGWPPGVMLDPHDHGGSSGALAVARGELVETAIHKDEAGGVRTSTRLVGRGEGLAFGPRHIHAVANDAISPAISVHVYSPRLTSMTHFDVTGGRLAPQHTVRYRPTA